MLGTDGYGRSDYRKTLRSFFEVDRHHVVLAALTELAKAGDDRRDGAEAGDRDLRHRPRAARAVAGLREAEVAGTEQVLVPDIGDFDDVPVIEVLVAVGDTVAAEDPLVVLESDKATMEVPSPSAGKVAAIEVAVGDKVKEGSPILTLEVSGGNGAEPRRAGAAPVVGGRAGRRRPRSPRTIETAADDRGAAAAAAPPARVPPRRRPARARRPPTRRPAVRRLARELGIDLASVTRVRPQGPDHQGGRPAGQGRAARPRPPRLRRRRVSPASTSRRGRRSTSSASARSSASR